MWDFEKYKNHLAIISENGEEISYHTLNTHIVDFQANIPHRALVLNLCSHTYACLLAYIACLQGQLVPLMLNENADDALLQSFIENYAPDYVWLPTERANSLKANSLKKNSITGTQEYSAFGYTLIKIKHEKTNSLDVNSPVPLHDELALLLTTSGSTGTPKLVRLSYKNLISNTKSIVEYLEIDAQERAIINLPLSYTYALSVINTHLAVGASLILCSYSLMQREFWNYFSTYKATSLSGVPYTYEMLNRLQIFKKDFPHLKSLNQAGGKLSEELHKKFATYALETGRKFFIMYGQTEASPRMSYLPSERALDKYGSIGIAVPDGKFTLIDVDGKEITEANCVGELVYQGENVMLGYAKGAGDLIKGDEQNGVLHTGDLAKRDEEGFYYIAGRMKRFLKIFGNRVNLDEVEQLIKNQFDFLDCACIGKDDAMQIFITQEDYIKEVHTFIAKKTALNFKVFKVSFIQTIPKTDSNKTLYSKL